MEGRLKQKVVSVAADLSLPPALQERVETGGQSAPAYGAQRSNKSKQVRICTPLAFWHRSSIDSNMAPMNASVTVQDSAASKGGGVEILGGRRDNVNFKCSHILLQSPKHMCLLKVEAHQELLRPAVLVLAELERRAQATFFDVQSKLPCAPQLRKNAHTPLTRINYPKDGAHGM